MTTIEIREPVWCPACGVPIDPGVGGGPWWPPDEAPPGGTPLLVALRDESGGVYVNMADYDPDTRTWCLIGDLTGATPVQPLAWCFSPELPQWLW